MKKILTILSIVGLLAITQSFGGDNLTRSFNKKKIGELRKKYPYDSNIRPKKIEPGNTNSTEEANNTNSNNTTENNTDNNTNNSDSNNSADNNTNNTDNNTTDNTTRNNTSTPPPNTNNRTNDTRTDRTDRPPRNTSRANEGTSTTAAAEGISPFIYILFAAAIIGIVLLILSSKSGGLVWNKSNKTTKPTKKEEETIHFHSKNILSATDQAIADEEYRKAIRLMFLSLLKKLSNKKLIQWEETKTNRDYYYEIKNKSIRRDFEDITFMYEYAWYGDVGVQKNQFSFVKSAFDKMMKKLK